ncbi:hypothetical protein A3G55_02635 [Candidatus Giovannonibacteria bacterium RIFCSPLOWO2_12_FULL_44_25]|uniref:Peptidase M23B n=3 Tax=Candidatus Giovannoniibacteriota TaxID=1752738 RepID=A0A0G1ICE3_9BACT|nr:MAG: Peptidase M23B [Parcubacteria group bacterium GW2011_GWC1_44_10]KKT57046.1 MAG: Peptidase M23B [Candidatus Giovannonibacteria bacterium GW2011_GWB1_44_23]KKT59483.1 MAG: Peptidase M23B [Candidatus Giovannonibacteria bacterium GW2011_GWA1_44_25]OGF49933.1 MAG: hypothetical protein A2120_04460 [Candidatus Giovannonibacteria bacterium GWA2_45_15]OGF60567.1 MAG: hypothetical protein A2656_00620 [Candidatus Giovannonibacteria bacterium RIFCSPHIGHO2_01_FULL_44_100]OGF60654.1 MAG: hypothetica
MRKIGPFLTAISPHSHKGPFRWAIDFLVPDGTIVLAAENGKVIELKENSNKWGASPKFRDLLNFVTVQHKDGEYSQYCHLSKLSVSNAGLRIGSLVKKGQTIATVGKTGWTDRDHLHFIVFRGDADPKNSFGFKSLRVKFE